MAKKKNTKSSKKKSSSKLLYLILIIVVALVCWFHEAILGFGFGSDKQEKVVVDKINAIEVEKVEPIKVNTIKAEVKQNVPEKKVEVSTKNTKKEVVNLSDIKNLERPASIKNRSERIMQRMNYITSYNKQWKMPNWVAWKIDRSELEDREERSNEFLPDPDLKESEAVTTNDYRGSGYDRGHMCPAGDNRYNWKAMQESFYMTNMCPQDHKLNSGDWNDLEEMCRFWAEKEDGLYVVCGPIVTNKSPKTIGRKQKVVVPDAFFKVILSTSGKQPRALGFIFENKNTRQHLGKYAKSIDEVEALTGINFFPALPDDIEVAVEKQINLRSWGLD